MDRPNRTRGLLLPGSVLVLFWLTLLPATASAEWDVDTFIELRNDAQSLYDAEKYDEALPRYRVLESMIEDALAADEIPEEQVEAASQALEIARYQIGRCQQSTDRCAAAADTYEALSDAAESAEIVAKANARLIEARVCHIQTLQKEGRLIDAVSRLELLETSLSEEPDLAGLDADTMVLAEGAHEDGLKSARELNTALSDNLAARANTLLSQDDCEGAEQDRTTLARLHPDASALTPLEQKIEQQCMAEPPPVAVDTSSAAPPVGAIVLLSIGAATLIGDGVYEFVFVNQTVQDFESAQDNCRATGTNCDRALSLESDIETAQIVSISLLGAGGAMVLAGSIWWIIDATGSDTETLDTTAFIAPGPDGATFGLSWTIP